MNKQQKIRKAEREVNSLERKLERCPAGDCEKVAKLSEAWDKANDRLMALSA